MRIRLARQAERGALEGLQRRASQELDDYRQALAANPEAIHLPAEQIALGEVLVADVEGTPAGFAVILDRTDCAELDGLFVEPARWRQGIGTKLVNAAIHLARDRGLTLVTVVANPTARGFYESCGFVVEGEVQTRFGSALRMSR